MMKSITIAALTIAATPVHAEEPLAARGAWVVDYADTSCVLQRDFGADKMLTTVGFKPSPFGNQIELVMMTPGGTGSYRAGKAALTLQPSGMTVNVDAQTYNIKSRHRAVTTLFTEGEAAVKLRSSNQITIAVAGGPSRTIKLPGLTKALGALKTCQADLVKSWGIDPVELDAVAVPPVAGYTGNWLTSDDYPATAQFSNKQGTTVIVWAIDTGGRVAECKVVKSSGTVSLDEAACSAVRRRARYKPAIGLDGKPIATHQMRNVIWILPE